MEIKKTIIDILNSLPIIKNKKWKSAGVYTYETDNTFTSNTDRFTKFNLSPDMFTNDEIENLNKIKPINNKKT